MAPEDQEFNGEWDAAQAAIYGLEEEVAQLRDSRQNLLDTLEAIALKLDITEENSDPNQLFSDNVKQRVDLLRAENDILLCGIQRIRQHNGKYSHPLCACKTLAEDTLDQIAALVEEPK